MIWQTSLQNVENIYFLELHIALSALILLVGYEKEHLAHKNWVMRYWCGYLCDTEVQVVCIWSGWCHFCAKTSSSVALLKSRNGFTFQGQMEYRSCPWIETVTLFNEVDLWQVRHGFIMMKPVELFLMTCCAAVLFIHQKHLCHANIFSYAGYVVGHGKL